MYFLFNGIEEGGNMGLRAFYFYAVYRAVKSYFPHFCYKIFSEYLFVFRCIKAQGYMLLTFESRHVPDAYCKPKPIIYSSISHDSLWQIFFVKLLPDLIIIFQMVISLFSFILYKSSPEVS